MLPQKRYREGNGVTITANLRGNLAAGAYPRQIPIYLRQVELVTQEKAVSPKSKCLQLFWHIRGDLNLRPTA